MARVNELVKLAVGGANVGQPSKRGAAAYSQVFF